MDGQVDRLTEHVAALTAGGAAAKAAADRRQAELEATGNPRPIYAHIKCTLFVLDLPF